MFRSVADAHDRTMQTHRRFMAFTAACVAVAALGLAGCSGGSKNASDRAYCDTAREWSINQLVPVDETDPAAMKQRMAEYAAFVTEAAEQAPEDVDADWQLNKQGVVGTLIPLFEKYGYSQERLEAEASDAEKALLQEPPDDVAQAQDRIHEYEGTVCAATQPAAADVTFEGTGSKAYCEASLANQETAGEVQSGGMQPDAVRALLTSPEYAQRQDALVRTAPPAIHDDAVKVRAFDTSQFEPLLEENGYDLRQVFLDGSPHEREVVQHRAPEVSTAYARIEAYEQQFCGTDDGE
jgi:hypothetical protein